jgi:hypothetical protein
VIVDPVGTTTGRNHSTPEDAREYFGPLMELASKSGVAFLGLTHLSKDKEALGRRIVEKARVVLKMTRPDPEGQPDRRRLWVDKTAAVAPSPLGITMGDEGNDYDSYPPTEPEAAPRRPGPLPAKLDACKRWLADYMAHGPARLGDLRRDAQAEGFASPTLYAARKALAAEEYKQGGCIWWKLTGATSEAA